MRLEYSPMAPNGEFELIARLARRLGEPGGRVAVGIGDDAAVGEAAGVTVVSVDALVDGVHFQARTWPPAAIGHKALAAALSDLAAMGAAPGEAYVALGIPAGLGAGRCDQIYEGLAALAAETGTAVAGGDVTRAPALFLAVTAVGHAAGAGELVRRAGALPGDAVAVTGALGGAAAGLLLLSGRDWGGERPPVPDGVARDLIARQQRPQPRLAEGRALATAGARAMIDLSDGLAGDAAQIAAASGVRLRIELERLPVQEGVAAVAAAAGRDPSELAAGGGEDYELLACLPPDRLDTATAALAGLGRELTAIGRVEEGSGAILLDAAGNPRPITGFDHLRCD